MRVPAERCRGVSACYSLSMHCERAPHFKRLRLDVAPPPLRCAGLRSAAAALGERSVRRKNYTGSRQNVNWYFLRITLRHSRCSASGKSFLRPRCPRFDCACARCIRGRRPKSRKPGTLLTGIAANPNCSPQRHHCIEHKTWNQASYRAFGSSIARPVSAAAVIDRAILLLPVPCLQ